MPDRIDAMLLALDAYQQHLLPDLAVGHRESRAEAEGLIHGLVDDLLRYSEHNDLDVREFVDQLVRSRLDHDSFPLSLPTHFRLNAEVEFRRRGKSEDTPNYRGFINELRASPTGSDTCAVRVPGLDGLLQANTSDLQLAVPAPLVPTRGSGIVFSAIEIEAAIIALSVKQLEWPEFAADPEMLADVAELSGTLANWSGTSPGSVLRHLRNVAAYVLADSGPDDGMRAHSPRELAATDFPDDVATALLTDGPPRQSRPGQHSPPAKPHRQQP